MSTYIHDIVTANPKTYINQQVVRDIMKSRLASDRKTEAIIHRIYSQSGIEKRYTVIDDFTDETKNSFFNSDLDNAPIPSTADRNIIYKNEATKLYVNVGKEILDRNPNVKKSDITHVITVSCTGFFAPGPDFEVVKGLGLNSSTQRYHIGFMGCYAAFPALRMAKSFCESDTNATVLVICTELCSIHFQYKTDPDNLIASSVFADGSAGVLVSSKEPTKPAFLLDDFATSLAYEGEQDMAWTIGDTGFNMILSSYVPEIIGSNIEDILAPLFEKLSILPTDIDLWAVHPGGRAIIDKVEQAMELTEVQVASSRNILANYGNMSSATVLFVLKDMLESNLNDGKKILSMAFGPGLTIESGILTSVNS